MISFTMVIPWISNNLSCCYEANAPGYINNFSIKRKYMYYMHSNAFSFKPSNTNCAALSLNDSDSIYTIACKLGCLTCTTEEDCFKCMSGYTAVKDTEEVIIECLRMYDIVSNAELISILLKKWK